MALAPKLVSQIYSANSADAISEILKTKEFSFVKNNVQVITDHNKPLSYFKFARNQFKRLDLRRFKSSARNDNQFFLIEIDRWRELDVASFKKTFKGVSGIVVILCKSLTLPHGQEELKQNVSSHNFSRFVDGLSLKVIVKNNVEDLVITGKFDTTNRSFPALKRVRFDNASFVSTQPTFNAPNLADVEIRECANNLLNSLDLYNMSSLDILIENTQSEAHDEEEYDDPIGKSIYQIQDSTLPRLIWANLRNFSHVGNLDLPKIQNMLLLTVPVSDTPPEISKINAPVLNELTIEFWKKLPKIEDFVSPKLKSIKLTRIVDTVDVIENKAEDSNLETFAHVPHWELVNSLDLLEKTRIPETIEMLNITTFRDEEDQRFASMAFPSLKTLNLNRLNDKGDIPRIQAPNITGLSVTFDQGVFNNLDNLTNEQYPLLKNLEIYNFSNDTIVQLPKTTFRLLETLKIVGPIFPGSDLSGLSRWKCPKLKHFSYELQIDAPENLKITANFHAPSLNTLHIRVRTPHYKSTGRRTLSLDGFSALRDIKLDGINALSITKTENLETLISLPDTSLDSIIADDLSNLKKLVYEHTDTLLASEVENIGCLNPNVKRNTTAMGDFVLEEDTYDEMEGDKEDVGTYDGGVLNDDDIEEVY